MRKSKGRRRWFLGVERRQGSNPDSKSGLHQGALQCESSLPGSTWR